MSKAERRDAEAVSDRAAQVLSSAAPSCPSGDGTCLVAPTVASADQARRALAAAAFERPVTRMARAGDLAPEGSLLAAVDAGIACVVLIQDRDSQRGFIGGRLPGGSCLAA